MTPFIRTHWRRISTGVMLLALAGLGGHRIYRSLTADCCAPGVACCHPGAACCHGHDQAQAMR